VSTPPSACIDVRHLSKRFTLNASRPRSFQSLFLDTLHGQRQRSKEALLALDDVSFGVFPGETVALIGQNGSGKSTCLKLLSRIIEPTEGHVRVNGRVSALLELGVGFHPELTGRENIFLYGAVLGVPRRELATRLDEIVAFAELERFLDMPVKFYSSGMYVRLGFATAVSVEPDILLIDEVLAVGDQSFQTKCLMRIQEMHDRGVTIVFVSHDLDMVASLCSRAIWFDHGRLAADGPADATIALYLTALKSRRLLHGSGRQGDDAFGPEDGTIAQPPRDGQANVTAGVAYRRTGTLTGRIYSVAFLNAESLPTQVLQTRGRYTLAIDYEARDRLAQPAFGFAIHRADGSHVTGADSSLSGVDIGPVLGPGQVLFQMPDLTLTSGDYVLSVVMHRADGQEIFDHQQYVHSFSVVGDRLQARGDGTMVLGGRWRHTAGASR